MDCFLALTERDFFKVFLLHIQLDRKVCQSITLQYFERYYSIPEAIVEEGKKEGSIHSSINSRVFCFMFSEAFTYLAFRSIFFERGIIFKKSRKPKR